MILFLSFVVVFCLFSFAFIMLLQISPRARACTSGACCASVRTDERGHGSDVIDYFVCADWRERERFGGHP